MSEKQNPVEQFVLLAKGAKGAAAVELVKQALEAPGVYVFGELLDTPNIKEVSNYRFRCTCSVQSLLLAFGKPFPAIGYFDKNVDC